MLRLRGSRRTGGEAGFTLVEILAVVGIIAILAAIAIPTFEGAKRNGYNSKAQASVRSALSAQRTYYVDYQTYTTDQAALRKIEPNIDHNSTDSRANGVKAVIGGNPAGSVVVLVSWSQSGTQYCIMNVAQDQSSGNVNGQNLAGTYYARTTTTVSSPPGSIALGQCGSSYTRSETGWQ
jgi:prepilin-type N-terminal cleavage/methylation domain-containing protein